MRRVIVPLTDFNEALAALDSRVPLALGCDVACRIAERPERAPRVHGCDLHVLRTRGYGDYPAFNLFYVFDHWTLYLAHIELRDELEEDDDPDLWAEATA